MGGFPFETNRCGAPPRFNLSLELASESPLIAVFYGYSITYSSIPFTMEWRYLQVFFFLVHRYGEFPKIGRHPWKIIQSFSHLVVLKSMVTTGAPWAEAQRGWGDDRAWHLFTQRGSEPWGFTQPQHFKGTMWRFPKIGVPPVIIHF